MHILIQEQHLREVPQSRQSQVSGVPIKLQAQLEDSPQEDGGVTESVYVDVSTSVVVGIAKSECHRVLFLWKQKNYRQRVDELKFTSVADSSQMEHAKKSQELQSGVSPELPHPHHAAVPWAGHLRDNSTCCPARSRNQ